jgi:glycosyltransferase involved in cell wall biosynthesis
VRVRNTSSIYTSVGAKRNAAAEMASGQWIAWLDDDDVLLPHHLRKLKLVGDAAVLTCDGSYWFCGNKGEVSSGGAIAGIMRRDAVLATRFIDASAGEDTTMVRNLATRYGEVKDPTFDPSYVQRWCNGAHHISGSGANPAAHVPFRKNVLERIRDRREPVGYLKIIPTAPEYDYTALTQPIILDHWEKHRELMARLGVERRKL